MTPEIGRIYRLTEADYKFGVGPLAVRVTRVIREALYDNEPWWEVEGVAKNPTYNGPGQERILYVRGSALAPHLRNERPAPPNGTTGS